MSVPVSLRSASRADAPAIAALHATVWHATYRHLATPVAIAELTEACRLQHWQVVLSRDEPAALTLIAMINDQVVGFLHAAAPQEPLFGARQEIKYLYVDRTMARRGIGRLLLTQGALALQAHGHQAMALGVVAGNEAAIRFYEALGGTCIGRYTDPGPLWRSDNLLYAWDDLASFIGQLSAN